MTKKFPKLARLELQILEILWSAATPRCARSRRAFPSRVPPTPPCRRRCIGWKRRGPCAARASRQRAYLEPLVARDLASHRLLDTILSFFGGRAQPMMQQLAEAGKLTLDDVKDLEKAIRKRSQQQDAERTRKK